MSGAELTMFEANGRSLAVRRQPGAGPAIVWLGGFKSDMASTKAQALADWARGESRASVLFDYSGHGLSGGRFEDGTISAWLEDSLAVIEAFAGPAPILVGSSMGGWISILAALRLKGAPSMPGALVLIAPAVDFTETLMWARFPENLRTKIDQDGFYDLPSQYSDQPTRVTKALFEDGKRHMLLGNALEIGCPVHILQGMQDPDVPWRHALALVEHLPHDQVALTLINDGDHRLSRQEDIERLVRIVAGIGVE